MIDREQYPRHCTARWNGHDSHGRHVGSGVYAAVLRVPGAREVVRMMLIR